MYACQVETPILWPPHTKNWLIWKDPEAGKDWRWEEKGKTEDEMAGWHHWLNGLESEWTPGVGVGQGGLAYCGPWGHKRSNTTEWLNWTELRHVTAALSIRPPSPSSPSHVHKSILKNKKQNLNKAVIFRPWVLGFLPLNCVLHLGTFSILSSTSAWGHSSGTCSAWHSYADLGGWKLRPWRKLSGAGWCGRVGVEWQFSFSQTAFPPNSSQEWGFNILLQPPFSLTLSKIRQKTNFQVQKHPPGLAEPSFCFLTNSLLTLKTKGVFSGTASGFPFDKNQLLYGLFSF